MISTASPSSSRLALGPELAEALDRELALLAARGVDAVLELVHRDLAEDGRDLALDGLGEQRRAAGRARVVSASSRPKTSSSANTEAVSATVSGVD